MCTLIHYLLHPYCCWQRFRNATTKYAHKTIEKPVARVARILHFCGQIEINVNFLRRSNEFISRFCHWRLRSIDIDNGFFDFDFCSWMLIRHNFKNIIEMPALDINNFHPIFHLPQRVGRSNRNFTCSKN